MEEQDLSFFRVNERCNGCLACVENCPASALAYHDQGKKRTLKHNMTLCARCGNCWRICPQNAIVFAHMLNGLWNDVVTMDLVQCKVCGEPLYTVKYEKTLNGKLKQELETLCPHHRQELPVSTWKRMKGVTDKMNEGTS